MKKMLIIFSTETLGLAAGLAGKAAVITHDSCTELVVKMILLQHEANNFNLQS